MVTLQGCLDIALIRIVTGERTEQATAWKAVGSESRQFEIDCRHAWARLLVR